jgi:hypothetical protein
MIKIALIAVTILGGLTPLTMTTAPAYAQSISEQQMQWAMERALNEAQGPENAGSNTRNP